MEVPSKPLKILQLTSGLDVNGALVHCKLLSQQLARRGHQVTIACRQQSWLWSQFSELPVRVVTCQMNRWPLSDLTEFAEWMKREQFDVMHSHMSSAHMFGIIMKKMTGIPVVATAHCRHVQPWWRFNDTVIANSASTYRFHKKFNLVPSQQLVTIHPFIDTQKFREPARPMYRAMRRDWRFPMDASVLAIAGDVVPHKGHHWLFKCLPDLLQAFPELRVILVGRFRRGESYTNRLRQHLVDHQLYKRVKWLGRRNNMQDVLGAADLVVMPSLVEAFGMVALESMAVGTPVVASETGGLKELITHRQNGLLVPPRNAPLLGGAITRLLTDPTLRTQIIQGGLQTIQERFTPEVLTRQIETVLYSATQSEKKRLAA
ncbi:MAG: glycosyltransferase family 4 protein [Pirellulaceae bacterium]|nr:glycosyltransferase family 4 protein [Pirellulaceae bacterium]MDG2104916.1 glycosyltransferase family 4 protein [Pirellulaceae bacterium]